MEHSASVRDGERCRRVAREECSSDFGFCQGVIWYGGRGRILTTAHLTSLAMTTHYGCSRRSRPTRRTWQTLRSERGAGCRPREMKTPLLEKEAR